MAHEMWVSRDGDVMDKCLAGSVPVNVGAVTDWAVRESWGTDKLVCLAGCRLATELKVACTVCRVHLRASVIFAESPKFYPVLQDSRDCDTQTN